MHIHSDIATLLKDIEGNNYLKISKPNMFWYLDNSLQRALEHVFNPFQEYWKKQEYATS